MNGRPLLVVAIALSACPTSARPPEDAPTREAAPDGLVRGCASAVFGDPNLDNASIVGPLALVGVREAATLEPRAFRERQGRLQAIKVLAVVMGAEDVTVTVPPSERAHVALLYDPRARGNRNGFPFSAGHARVTFRACPSGGGPVQRGLHRDAPAVRTASDRP